MLIRILILSISIYSGQCGATTFMQKSKQMSMQHLKKINAAKKQIRKINSELEELDLQLLITSDMIKENKNYIGSLK